MGSVLLLFLSVSSAAEPGQAPPDVVAWLEREPLDSPEARQWAAASLRKLVQKPNSFWAHRRLALVLWLDNKPKEALQHWEQGQSPGGWPPAHLLDFELAAIRCAVLAVVQARKKRDPLAPRLQALVDQFPRDGLLHCCQAAAFFHDGDRIQAQKSLHKARKLKADPEKVLGRPLVQQIETGAWGPFLRFMVGLTVLYTLSITGMLLVGWLLGRGTRGPAAQRLLGAGPDYLIVPGEKVRFPSNSWITRAYVLVLVLGVMLFHVVVSLLIAILAVIIALTAVFLMQVPAQALKVLILVVAIGLSLLWTLIRSLLAFPGRIEPGLPLPTTDHPRLHELLTDLGHSLEVRTVDEVRLVPGALVRLHLQGRGPFGILGVRRRVLLLGWSALRLLTIGQLQALLACAFVPVSWKNTFAARFLPRAALSIRESLQEMRREPLRRLHVRLFYWLFAAYYRAYAILASPFLRSRVLLADRIASCLYGSDVFTAALTRVAVDAALFEMALHDLAARWRVPEPSLFAEANAFRAVQRGALTDHEQAELSDRFHCEARRLVDSVPTLADRLEAAAALPRATHTEAGPALLLFEEPERIELELTAFLLGIKSEGISRK
jgi:hypothetical protein